MALSSSALFFLLGAAVAIGLGAALRDLARHRAGPAARLADGLGWVAIAGGYAAAAGLAFAHLTGRLGPAQLWFRAPTFFASILILAAGAAWWLRRPASRLVRFGMPAIGLGGIALLLLAARLDGHSTPVAMLMPTMNRAAPALSFVDANGRRRALEEFRGKVVLVNFWATWCAPCRHEMPMLSKLQSDHADDGLVVLFISLEEPDVLADFRRANHFAGVQGRLEAAAPFYDAGKFYPLTYLIDRQGRVAERWSGRPRREWIDAAVRQALG